MKKKFARIVSNALCALGAFFLLFFLYFIIAEPLGNAPRLSVALGAILGGVVAWLLDDWREENAAD